VGEVKANVPLIVEAVTVPEYVNAPKLSVPVTVPAPVPPPAVFSVPDPEPTVADENVKLSVFPDTVPEPLPVSFPSPRLARPITPDAVTVDPFTVIVAVNVPDTPYLVSVQVPVHVVVPERGPKVLDDDWEGGVVGVEDEDLQPDTVVPASSTISTHLAPLPMLMDILNVYMTRAACGKL
jgi:hypothetical protein